MAIEITKNLTQVTISSAGVAGGSGTSGTSGFSINSGSFATTGSNQFNGNQTITGSFNVTGSVNIDNVIKLAPVTNFPNGQAGMLVASASYGKQIYISTMVLIGNG